MASCGQRKVVATCLRTIVRTAVYYQITSVLYGSNIPLNDDDIIVDRSTMTLYNILQDVGVVLSTA